MDRGSNPCKEWLISLNKKESNWVCLQLPEKPKLEKKESNCVVTNKIKFFLTNETDTEDKL